jgi:hypothetical protein
VAILILFTSVNSTLIITNAFAPTTTIQNELKKFVFGKLLGNVFAASLPVGINIHLPYH